MIDAVSKTPTRDHIVAWGGTERPSRTPRRRCGAGAHRYPPEARRQPRRGALPPGVLRWCRWITARTPAWIGWGHIRQGRHQRAATAGAPFASPFAHVPPSAALGAHLDHRTSLAPATMRAAAPRSGEERGNPAQHARRCGPPQGGTVLSADVEPAFYVVDRVHPRSVRNMNSYLWLSTVSTGLSTTAVRVAMASVQPQPVDPGAIVDNTGRERHAIDSPKRCLSEMHCPTKQQRIRVSSAAVHTASCESCARRRHHVVAAQRPITWQAFPCPSQRVMIAITKSRL